MSKRIPLLIALLLSLAITNLPSSSGEEVLRVRDMPNLPLDQTSTYFLMIDRFENGDRSNDGGIFGDSRLIGGFDPSDISFFHGGDFKGITERLDYIKGLGFNAIWITPPVKNVSGGFGAAAYHGYAGVDFTTVDSRFGSEQDFKTLIDQAHRRGMKVFVDVVVNHTADIIQPKNGDRSYVDLRSRPYRDATGRPFKLTKRISSGATPFPKLSSARSFPKVPISNPSQENIKKPAFLRDLTNYHNRGDSTFEGESVEFGDFFGLDDLFTEKPAVVEGWIETWSRWITEFDIDGMRIDTYKHVNDEFWKQFIPAILKQARAAGKSEFPIFGEVYDGDPASLAHYIRDVSAPSLLDFGFQNRVERFVANGIGANELAQLFNDDDFYTTESFQARGLATFLGNHDMGRIGLFIKKRNPSVDQAALIERAELAMAMLFLLRGSPVGYYGDEMGLIGDPGDKGARQDLFPTEVSRWQSEERIGMDPIGTRSSFDLINPLQAKIAQLQNFAQQTRGFRTSDQRTRLAEQGTFVVSRSSGEDEYWIAFNATDQEISRRIETLSGEQMKVLLGDGRFERGTITLPARSYLVLSRTIDGVARINGSITLSELDSGFGPIETREFAVKIASERNALVSFYSRVRDGASWGSWDFLGSANRPTFKTERTPGDLYRIFVSKMRLVGKVQLVAVTQGVNGQVLRSNLLTVASAR